jgi:hypothetical protein
MLTTGIYTPALFQMVFNYIINIFELLWWMNYTSRL